MVFNGGLMGFNVISWDINGVEPSGNDSHSYGKLPFIVDSPMKNGGSP